MPEHSGATPSSATRPATPASPATSSATLPTTADVIAHLPWRWRVQGAIFLVGGLGFMFDAWDVALNGFLIPLLSDHWDLTVGQAAWIATVNLIGMAVGAFVWGGIADRIGRKSAFTLTLLTFTVFTAAGAFSPDLVLFCAFRFLAGFGLGGCIPVDYALVGEFSPAKHRGRVLTALDGWWPVGATLCALTSAWLIQFFDWRALMLVMIVPALLVFAIRLFVPESPMYLASAGRHEEADAIVSRLVARTGAEVTAWRRAEVASPARAGGAVGAGAGGAGAGGASAGGGWRSQLAAATGQIAGLWRWSWKITLTAWLLFVSVLLLYYAALTWLPGILRRQGLDDQAAFLVTGQMTGIGILGVLASALLVEVLGRRWLLGASAIAASAALVGFAWVLGNSGAELVTSAQVLILAFGFLIQISVPTLYTYVSELYPTHLRASGFGWASSASRVATGVAPLVFGSFMWPVLGLTWTFVCTGALVVVAMLVMAFLTHDTTGRELD
ncbi:MULTISPECIES: MFS transporter [Brevibacterium]|uniref:MFS transporter n=1 Tax=Brevibacterium salitolerans TaxID=1403566 RepID=A0ABN2X576_9MICO|nr:MFS transporter [Brevibacterium sp.]